MVNICRQKLTLTNGLRCAGEFARANCQHQGKSLEIYLTHGGVILYMLRALFLLWALPIILFGMWYGLSVNDYSFGTIMFSRALHDHVFAIYAGVLGVEPETLPPMILKALITDTLIVFGFIAFRKRKSWWPSVAPHVMPTINKLAAPFQPAFERMSDSLSSNPWSMKLAATWSTFAALFRRDKSASNMARSAATVESRSSQ